MDWTTLDLSLSTLRKYYQNNDLTPRQLMEHLLTLKPVDNHNIWIERLTLQQIEPYLSELEKQDADTLPLYGIPFAIKDNIDLAGIDTTAGCEAYRYQAEAHAHVVNKLIQAGAIPMGKTNLDQFATGLVGTRSPFGACKNAFNPDFISGGSSSGSAVATAKGLVSFALGTDTAGSGRVPAAFNNLIGLKPSRGILSNTGVVPACKSLDCVSIFALTVDDANSILAVTEGFDNNDAYSRKNPFDNSARRYSLQKSTLTLGIPNIENLQFFGEQAAHNLYESAIDNLRSMGHRIVEIDISPLMQAARLLYEGPWVTERYIAIQPLIDTQPDKLLPEINTIISAGKNFSAIDCFQALYKLQHHQQACEELFEQVDCLITPTTPTCFRIEEVQKDPIKLNSQLGTYTNFMNLLDLCAIAIPAGFLPTGVGFGITLQAPAFQDRLLLSLANQYINELKIATGTHTKHIPTQFEASYAAVQTVDLAVCGAHLEGMPLNWQLTEREARKLELTTTSANYRLYAMTDGRPALTRDVEGGKHIEVEIWRLKKSRFGSFVADVPPPLGIGKIELADGRWITSFIAEPRATNGAQEITNMGGWRNYCKSKA